MVHGFRLTYAYYTFKCIIERNIDAELAVCNRRNQRKLDSLLHANSRHRANNDRQDHLTATTASRQRASIRCTLKLDISIIGRSANWRIELNFVSSELLQLQSSRKKPRDRATQVFEEFSCNLFRCGDAYGAHGLTHQTLNWFCSCFVPKID